MSQYSKVQCKQNGKEPVATENVGSSNLPLVSSNQMLPPHPLPGPTQKPVVVSSKDRPDSPSDTSTAPDDTSTRSTYPGMEQVENYDPIGIIAFQAKSMESQISPEDNWRSLDAAYAGGGLAQEMASAAIFEALTPLAPSYGGQEGAVANGLNGGARFINALDNLFEGIHRRIGERQDRRRNRRRNRRNESGTISGSSGSSILEVINGVDDRVRIEDTTKAPWSGIIQLNILGGNCRQYKGTGFCIAPRTIITAGHCVYMHDAGGWAKEITLSAGRNGNEWPFGQRVSSNFSAPSGWVNAANRAEDYGVIFLDEPFSPFEGEMPFIFPFAAKDDEELLDMVLNLAGYPASYPFNGNQLLFHARTPADVTSKTILYRNDSEGGQSGSPVHGLQDNKRVVVGIHTNGFPYANSATRITPEMAALFEEWRQAGQ